MSKNDNTPENSEFSFVPREEGAESGVEAGAEDLKAAADEVVKPPAKSKQAHKKKSKAKKKKKKSKKKGRKNKKKSRLATIVFVIVLLCLAVVFGWMGYVGAYLYPLFFGSAAENTENAAPITEEQKEAFASGQMVVLMMGSDRREGWDMSRSDTLMVAFVDLDQKQIRLLSIPRDTYITIPTSGEQTKINHAYAFGGVELTKQTLESNFGIKPDYFLDVDFQGFIDVVDALGGITLNVPMKMYYPDEGIDLEPGVQELDGSKALQFCRFRSDGKGDLGRVDRQQAFLVALKEEMFQAGTLLKIPEICTAVMSNMQTDFTGTQMLEILLQLKNGVDFQTYQPDGIPDYKDDISYVFTTEKGQRLIDALVSFEDIPSDIKATTDKVDVTPDGAESNNSDTTGE